MCMCACVLISCGSQEVRLVLSIKSNQPIQLVIAVQKVDSLLGKVKKLSFKQNIYQFIVKSSWRSNKNYNTGVIS